MFYNSKNVSNTTKQKITSTTTAAATTTAESAATTAVKLPLRFELLQFGRDFLVGIGQNTNEFCRVLEKLVKLSLDQSEKF